MNNREEIRKKIDGLSSQEAKQLLRFLTFQLDEIISNTERNIDPNQQLKIMYNLLLASDRPKAVWEPDAGAVRVHIAFGDSFAGSLKVALKHLGLNESDKMVVVRDQFAIGPLWRMHDKEGRLERAEWFEDHINDEYGDDWDSEQEEERYVQNLIRQFGDIPSDASIVIWCGRNAAEQVGLRYAVHELKGRSNDIFVFDAAEACERKFNTADRFAEYRHLGEIPADKLEAVMGEMELAGPISNDQKRLLEQEWLALSESEERLRIWEEDRIVSVDEAYFDAYLLETVDRLHARRGEKRGFIKAARVIGEALGHCSQSVGDGFFEYRLRQLVYNGLLEIKGVPRAMRYYSVRRKKT